MKRLTGFKKKVGANKKNAKKMAISKIFKRKISLNRTVYIHDHTGLQCPEKVIESSLSAEGFIK